MTEDDFFNVIMASSSAFARELLAVPNSERPAIVWKTIGDCDVAFGVWHEPHGTGIMLLKGDALLFGAALSDTPPTVATVGIPCTGREHALALQGAVSEGRGPRPNLKVVALN